MGMDDEKKDVPFQDLSKPEAPEENGDEGEEAPPPPPPGPPKPKAPYWLYKNIEDVSKNAAKVYLVYMGFLAYAALTAISTPDRGLILNDKAHLPIVNIDVSANGFFIVAPLLVVLVFLYLQLYIQRQIRLLDYLSRNYDHLEERRLYPWIVNIAAYPDQGMMGGLQRLTVALCIWIAPIIVLNIISLSYIRKHEPFWSYFVAGLTLVGTLLISYFWRSYGSRLKDRLSANQSDEGTTPKKKLRLVVEYSAILVLLAYEISVLLLLVPWANKGASALEWVNLTPTITLAQSGKKKLSDMVVSASGLVCVNLSFQKLVDEPKVDYPELYWQNLSGAHLEGANLSNSVLKRADLSKAHLEKAYLSFAILEGADLRGAHLGGAYLRGVILMKANLRGAHLEGADLEGAHLEGAHLERAHLEGVILMKANLRGAHLEGAHLERADLRGAHLGGAILQGAGLTVSQLKQTKTLYKATWLPGLDLEEVQKQYPHLLKKPKPEPQTKEKPK